MKTKIFIIAAIFFFLPSLLKVLPFGKDLGWTSGGASCSANNLSLGGTITVVSGDQISFTVQWDNSWYASSAPSNWDAVWLFVKYKDCTTSNWLHAPLSTTATDHTVTGGVLQVDAVTDGMGVFVRRAAAGSGNIAAATVTLKLNGVATGTYNFKVFGIEMVNVPQNDFQLGDGAAVGTFNSITITSEAAVATGGTGSVATLPAAYPKGWNSFYSMKYELTQEQYVDFLNTLTYDQQTALTAVLPNVMTNNWAIGSSAGVTGRSRNGIKVMTSGVASTTPAVYGCDLGGAVGAASDGVFNGAYDGQNIAMNFMGWTDLLAYLDWAALRPMTDLEYEKACRGVSGRVSGEYSWGNTTFNWVNSQGCATAATNDNAVSELGARGSCAVVTGNGLCVANGDNNGAADVANTTTINNKGPLRVGFAAAAATTRITAGATYYGALDMTGNVWEQVVATNATGSTFTGTLGDGTLNAAGSYTNADWPGTTGAGTRGASWLQRSYSNPMDLYFQTSNRALATSNTYLGRTCETGGRGVR